MIGQFELQAAAKAEYLREGWCRAEERIKRYEGVNSVFRDGQRKEALDINTENDNEGPPLSLNSVLVFIKRKRN